MLMSLVRMGVGVQCNVSVCICMRVCIPPPICIHPPIWLIKASQCNLPGLHTKITNK
jgi:hypothetical protein